MIDFRDHQTPPAELVASLYRASGLDRPVDDLPRIRQMFAGANLVCAAWHGDRLVGILRGWSDGARDGYICDLAVDPQYQRRNIGRRLLERAMEGRPHIQFVLRASAVARDYYQHLGWKRIENGWYWPRTA